MIRPNKYSKAQWDDLNLSCRFGDLTPGGICECRNAQCSGFGGNPVCLFRDGERHRTVLNTCFMLEHACNAKKRRLYFHEGACQRNKSNSYFYKFEGLVTYILCL